VLLDRTRGEGCHFCMRFALLIYGEIYSLGRINSIIGVL
jgi:hypothetical protein